MNKFLKRISLLLALLMITGALAACGSSSSTDDGTGSREFIDAIPDDVKFEGKTFTVLARSNGFKSDYEYEITADENATDTVNQAVFQRNSKIEKRFGCKINPYLIPGAWSGKSNFINTFKNSIMSNSQAFDIIMSYAAYMGDLGMNEYFVNLYDPGLKYINFNAPYYRADMVKELTVNDRLYYLVGDYNVTYLQLYFMMYFNKSLAADLNIGNLYELVKNGEWTFDKMVEYSRLAYNDLDGDGYKSEGDVLGLATDYGDTVDAYYANYNTPLSTKNEKGIPEINLDVARVSSVLEKTVAFFDEDCVYTSSGSSTDEDGSLAVDRIFEEGRALFYPETLQNAERLRNVETDFGLIPCPKWDKDQKGYYSLSHDGYSVCVVPKDAADLEFCGAMIEALNAESSAEGGVKAAYYDIALKDKYSRDDESGEMIDLALEGAKINFAHFHGVPLGTAAQIYFVLLPKKMSNISSYWAENIKGYTRSFNKVLATYGVDV